MLKGLYVIFNKDKLIYFTFFHTLYFSTFKQPSSILKSLFWEKQMGVEAAESGKNSITEENTDENEETEDSTGADDEKWLKITSLRTKCFSQCKLTNSWKSIHLVVMQKI